MIIPDVNLLLYAYDADSPYHANADAWWQACLSGNEPVGLPPVVLFGFVRISTHARVFKHPMTCTQASDHIGSWLERPIVQILEHRADHVNQVLVLLRALGTGGNLVTDAQVAAHAIEHDAVLHTCDSDFLRFPGLRWHNPIMGTSSSRVRKSR